jgi:polyphosphate kinase
MKIIPKEISWLYFNERVLQEAQNTENYLYDRIRFLGIYSNNMDEFFRVRVATLKRLAQLGKKANSILGYSPQVTLNKINQIVLKQHHEFNLTYRKILLELKKKNVFILNEKEINEKQKIFIEDYFVQHVRPLIVPIIVNQIDEIPCLEDNNVYLAVHIVPQEIITKEFYAIVNLPTDILPRFIQVPTDEENIYNLIFLDDVIRIGLKNIFNQFNPKKTEAYTFKLTRDAELDITDDIHENYLEKIMKGLKKRKTAEPVRFIYDSEMPPQMLKVLLKKLNIEKSDTIIAGDRYHNFKDLLQFPELPIIDKTIPPLPIIHPLLPINKSTIQQAFENDILLHFPYHSFNHFIDLLREAAIHPHVKSIYITLYRLANPSNVVNALINAARNGKKVTAYLELQARFDEQNNVHYANKLRDEGVKVHLGIPGLKIHSKICLIEFQIKKANKYIACVGSGNFNGKTAKIYTDVMLITSDKRITRESLLLFQFMRNTYMPKRFKHLIVSPLNSRQKLERLIEQEIKNAKNNKPAYIDIKINNLSDDRIIKLLYNAAQAGVKIRLNIRAMCSMLPKTLKNIEIIGIVDYYLEHSRIFIFCNNNNPLYYIGSADLMTRNLDHRVELLCPVYDEVIKRVLKNIFECSWNENIRARIIHNNNLNELRKDNKPPFRSQFEMYKEMYKYLP